MMVGAGKGIPLSLSFRWKINDCVEVPQYSCRPFLHLYLAAPCCNRRAALASPLSLCRLHGEQLCGWRDPHRLGPRQRTVPCKGKPQLRQKRKQQHSHPHSAYLSELLIRATGRRGAQNNCVLRGMLVAKDTATIKSSSLYLKRQTKSLEKLGARDLRKHHCHTSIKFHLLAKHLKSSDGFLYVRLGHSQDPSTGHHILT